MPRVIVLWYRSGAVGPWQGGGIDSVLLGAARASRRPTVASSPRWAAAGRDQGVREGAPACAPGHRPPAEHPPRFGQVRLVQGGAVSGRWRERRRAPDPLAVWFICSSLRDVMLL